ncbi:hypothetical protein [Arthrobacter rhombi]|uniref:hypothetical protein n=1 Tax=Arthrobacter rhombi TaxID=71253 RepID=UPI003FD25E9A
MLLKMQFAHKFGDGKKIMSEVKYKRYRDYLSQRIAANDTVMGLLAGSKLASQSLAITAGSQMLLKDIFPQVPHIDRFNLKAGKARGVLEDAENLLGVLAVPQIMALHEDLITGMLELLERSMAGSTNPNQRLNAKNMHARFEGAASISFTSSTLDLFQLLRMSRNAHIHNGGVVSKHFADELATCAPASLQLWRGITGESFPAYKEGDKVELRLPALIGTLAITKRLANEANEGLQQSLSPSVWADLVAEDCKSPWVPGNDGQQKKRILGIARKYYAAVNITEADLMAAQQRLATP